MLFFPGCNFRCPFCHNHDLVVSPHDTQSVPRDYVLERLESLSDWIDGVCITGGEPTLQPDLKHFIELLRSKGFLVKLDTNGTRPDLLEDMMAEGLLDYVAMDVKAPLNHVHYGRAAGVPVHLESIEKSIRLLKKGNISYEFRTTVVPCFHGENEIRAMAESLEDCAVWRLQDFNPQNTLDRGLKTTIPYDSSQMQDFTRIAGQRVHAVY